MIIHHRLGFGLGGGLLLMGLCFLALVALVVLVLVVVLPRRSSAAPPPAPPVAPPAVQPGQPPQVSAARAILDERLARGEVTVEEYQQTRSALDG